MVTAQCWAAVVKGNSTDVLKFQVAVECLVNKELWVADNRPVMQGDLVVDLSSHKDRGSHLYEAFHALADQYNVELPSETIVSSTNGITVLFGNPDNELMRVFGPPPTPPIDIHEIV